MTWIFLFYIWFTSCYNLWKLISLLEELTQWGYYRLTAVCVCVCVYWLMDYMRQFYNILPTNIIKSSLRRIYPSLFSFKFSVLSNLSHLKFLTAYKKDVPYSGVRESWIQTQILLHSCYLTWSSLPSCWSCWTQRNTERQRTSPEYKKTPSSSSFQALPTFKGLGSQSQRRVTDSVFLWVEEGGRQGWVRWDGDGELCEAQPPLDKLELQTVETCEIRMEPSLLRCDLKDRACSGPPCPPSALYFVCFSLGKSIKREGTARNDGLKVFVKDSLCTWCHWKGKAEILQWYF